MNSFISEPSRDLSPDLQSAALTCVREDSVSFAREHLIEHAPQGTGELMAIDVGCHAEVVDQVVVGDAFLGSFDCIQQSSHVAMQAH